MWIWGSVDSGCGICSVESLELHLPMLTIGSGLHVGAHGLTQ